MFADGELIALAQANGHWADVGGSVPGSFDVGATDHFGEGIRIPPVRVVDSGTPRDDVIALIAVQHRARRRTSSATATRRSRRRAWPSRSSSG